MMIRFTWVMGILAGSCLAEAEVGLSARCERVMVEVLERHETVFWPAMHAAEGLLEVGHGEVVRERLTPLLVTERDGQRRCGLARELARAGDEERLGLVVDLLRAEDPYAHVHAAESLFKLGWAEDLNDVEKRLLGSENARLRIMLAALLAGQGRELGLKVLREGMEKEKDPALVYLFAWALGQVGGVEDRVRIKRRLPDIDAAFERSFLEHALARLGDLDAVQTTRENLGSADARVRAYAAEVCGKLRLAGAAATLERLLEDEDPDVRVRAAHSLMLILKEQAGTSR